MKVIIRATFLSIAALFSLFMIQVFLSVTYPIWSFLIAVPIMVGLIYFVDSKILLNRSKEENTKPGNDAFLIVALAFTWGLGIITSPVILFVTFEEWINIPIIGLFILLLILVYYFFILLIIIYITIRLSKVIFKNNYRTVSIILPIVLLTWLFAIAPLPYKWIVGKAPLTYYLCNARIAYDCHEPEEKTRIIEQDDIRRVSDCIPPILDGGDGLDTTGCGMLEVGVTVGGTTKNISEAHNWQFSTQQGERVKFLLIPISECPTLVFKFLNSQGELIRSLNIAGSSSSCLNLTRFYYFDPPTAGTYILRIETPENPGEYLIEIER